MIPAEATKALGTKITERLDRRLELAVVRHRFRNSSIRTRRAILETALNAWLEKDEAEAA